VIVEVQDNLNTHNASSFYENLPPAQAYSLMKRFELHYTPKKGSWLNMAELELSALIASMFNAADSRHQNFKSRAELDCQRTKQDGSQSEMAVHS
jgi:hypothetical protein